jgi:hypothetical protein
MADVVGTRSLGPGEGIAVFTGFGVQRSDRRTCPGQRDTRRAGRARELSPSDRRSWEEVASVALTGLAWVEASGDRKPGDHPLTVTT